MSSRDVQHPWAARKACLGRCSDGSRRQLALRERAAERAGFSAFFGSSTFFGSSLAFLPLIGSSISRWPATRFFGFLAFGFAPSAGASSSLARLRFASPSLARLRFKASIRLITLPLDFGADLAVIVTPLRFLLMRSI